MSESVPSPVPEAPVVTEEPDRHDDLPETDGLVDPDEAPAFPGTEPVRTGVAAVDGVLADLDRLDDMPLDGHLAVFEEAQHALRSALDADPGDLA